MLKERSLRLLLTATLALLLLFPLAAQSSVKINKESGEPRPDIITIDIPSIPGTKEMPVVNFLHDMHNKAAQGKCDTCHTKKDDAFVFMFKRTEKVTGKASQKLYHTNCVACHQQTADTNEKRGPVTCGECHQERTDLVSIWQPIGMDKSLHYRHSKAQDKKCERCHHQFDEVTKKLFCTWLIYHFN